MQLYVSDLTLRIRGTLRPADLHHLLSDVPFGSQWGGNKGSMSHWVASLKRFIIIFQLPCGWEQGQYGPHLLSVSHLFILDREKLQE